MEIPGNAENPPFRSAQAGSVPASSEQVREIERLRAETHQLRAQIAAERSTAASGAGSALPAEIARLQDQGEMYARRIDQEKRRIDELDKQMIQLHKQIAEQRTRMGGVNAARDRTEARAKQIRVLEDRLEKAQRRHNEAALVNRTVRKSIDSMRMERLAFERLAAKLQRELDGKRREISDIVEASNRAYAARDKAQAEMAELKAQADAEQQAFEKEWKELGKMIDADKKLKTIVNSVDVKSGKATETGGGGVGEKTNTALKWAAAKDKAAAAAGAASAAVSERVESYEDAFKRIQAATGIDDIDELVTTFLNAEDQNYALFNYVTELGDEVDKLDEGIAEIRQEIDKFRGQGAATDSQRRKVQADLEARLAAAEQRASLYDTRYQTAMRTITALKGGIANVFTKIGCDTREAHELFGGAGVTEKNLMQHLGLIEQRTNELLQMYAAAQQHATHSTSADTREDIAQIAEAMSVAVSTQAVNAYSPCDSVLNVVAPSTTGVSDQPGDGFANDVLDEDLEEEAEDSRPFTREELRAKTIRSMAHREKRAAVLRQQERGAAAAERETNPGKSGDHERVVGQQLGGR